MAPFDNAHNTHTPVDDAPTLNSTNFVTSGGVATALANLPTATGSSFTGIQNNRLVTISNEAAQQSGIIHQQAATTTTTQFVNDSGGLSVIGGAIETEVSSVPFKAHLKSNTSSVTVSDGQNVYTSAGGHKFLESAAGKPAIVGLYKLQMHDYTVNNGATIAEIETETDGTNGGKLLFATKTDGGNLAARMCLSEDGKLGVGVFDASLTSKLHVAGDANINGSLTLASDALISAANTFNISVASKPYMIRINQHGQVFFGNNAAGLYAPAGQSSPCTVHFKNSAPTGTGQAVTGATTFNGSGLGLNYINGSILQSTNDSFVRIFPGANDGKGMGVGGGEVSGYKFHVTGQAGGTTGWSQSSDDRLKTNERPITSALDIINKLAPQLYDFTEPTENRIEQQAGFIAQEVQIIPELAYTVHAPTEPDMNGNAWLSLRYNDLFVYNVAAVQELHAKVLDLEARLSSAGL